MAANWFRRLTERGFQFPRSYIVFDVETSGLDVNRDYICQFGHLVVEDHVPHKPEQTILDWTRCNQSLCNDFRQRLRATEYDFIRQGRKLKFTYDCVAEQGIDPIDVLEIYYDMFKQCQDAHCFFLTHNGFRYDSKIICSHFKRFLNIDFQLAQDRMIDTGLLEKARQMNFMIRDGEKVSEFYARIECERRKGVYWSLDRHCIPNYRLVEKHNLDMRNAHTAAFDCYATHLLMEEFRQQAEQ